MDVKLRTFLREALLKKIHGVYESAKKSIQGEVVYINKNGFKFKVIPSTVYRKHQINSHLYLSWYSLYFLLQNGHLPAVYDLVSIEAKLVEHFIDIIHQTGDNFRFSTLAGDLSVQLDLEIPSATIGATANLSNVQILDFLSNFLEVNIPRSKLYDF